MLRWLDCVKVTGKRTEDKINNTHAGRLFANVLTSIEAPRQQYEAHTASRERLMSLLLPYRGDT